MSFEILREHSKDNLGEGTSEKILAEFEKGLGIKLPEEFYNYLLEIGYSEIFGDEIYSIYEIPDKIPCKGLHWMNLRNELLEEGYLEFFSNDIDGVFYISLGSGRVYKNYQKKLFANSFIEFISKMINDKV